MKKLHTVEDTVNILLEENKPILFLDTCSVLDIIRVPERLDLNTFVAANKINENLSSFEFNVVLSSVFEKEWADNLENVMNLTKKAIDKQVRTLELLSKISEISISHMIETPNVLQHQFESILKNIAEDIISKSIVIEDCDPLTVKAIKRVRDNIPPSRKGKDSTKDCIMFEEFLEIGGALINRGFKKPLVFASSNKEEFDSPDIKNEVETKGMVYVTNLNHGLHLVSNFS